jgi:hypothetical protein
MNAAPRRSARLAAMGTVPALASAPSLPSPAPPAPRVKVSPKTHTEPITWTQDEMNEFGKVYYNYFREMNMYDNMEEQLIEYKRLGKVKFESRPCMKGFRLYRGYY